MKRLHLIIALAASMMLGACRNDGADSVSQSDFMEPDMSKKSIDLSLEESMLLKQLSNGSPILSQEEAVDIANELFNHRKLSKSATMPKCEVLSRPSASLSKSGNSSDIDTLMYVFNYGDNDGYAVVCADMRVPESVFAFSETGNLPLDTDNPGINMFLGLAEQYMDDKIAYAESKRDSLEESLNDKFIDLLGMEISSLSKKNLIRYEVPHVDVKRTFSIQTIKGPYMHTYWHQNRPFNDSIDYCYYHHRNKPAGCNAVATSQIMAYWNWPTYIPGIYLDWDYLNSDSIQVEKRKYRSAYYCGQVASLMRYVGAEINTDYACNFDSGDVSVANSDKDLLLLNRYGYHTTNFCTYSKDPIIQSLDLGRPVLIYGNEEPGKCGHIWVIDGYVDLQADWKYTKTIVYIDQDTYHTDHIEYLVTHSYVDSFYFYCKWGWNEDCDGYFQDGIFDCSNRYRIYDNGNEMIHNATSIDDNYQYNLHISTDIYH